jgi:hypothetical protein
MITKSDWQAVNEQMMAAQRRRLGGPPSAEEVLAYVRGELAPADAERVQDLLVCYPELARAMAEPFPREGAQRGDADFFPDAELEVQWASLQARRHARHAPAREMHPRFWPRAAAALAAALLLTATSALWQARTNADLQRALDEPRVPADMQLLRPDGSRGGEEGVTLSMRGESVLLALPVPDDGRYSRYRLALLAPDQERPVWRSALLRRTDGEPFELFVRRAWFTSGAYHVIVYGEEGTRQERLAAFTVRVRK